MPSSARGRAASVAFLAVMAMTIAACGAETAGGRTGDLDASTVDASIASTVASTPTTNVAAKAVRPNVPMPKADNGGTVLRAFGARDPEHPSITLARKLLAVDKRASERFVENTSALTLASEGFVSEAWQHPSPTDWSHLGAVLPHRASDFVRVSPVRIERWAMSLEPIGHASVAGAVDGGRVVYENALPDTDLIATSGDKWMEELYVLRSAGAPNEILWNVHLGSALTAQPLPNGEVQFLDEHHSAALRIHPPVAYDAHGASVATSLVYDKETLRLKINAAGAAYPIVVDPLIDVPVWTYVGQGSFGGTSAFGSSPDGYGANTLGGSWSTAANTLVMWGGGNDSVFLGDAYEFLTSSYPFSPTPPFQALGLGTITNVIGAGVAEVTNGGIVALGGSTASANAKSPTASHQLLYWPGPGNAVQSICTSTGGCAAQVSAGSIYFNSAAVQQTTPSSNIEVSASPMYGLVGSLVPSLGSVFFGTDRNTYLFLPYGHGAFGNFMTVQPISDVYHVPPARSYALMATDLTTGHGILAAGQSPSGDYLFDLWRFDGTVTNGQSWTPVCGAQYGAGCPFIGRAGGTMSYDAARKQMIMTGGYNGSGNTNDVWEYDDATGTFTEIAANGSPAAALPYQTCQGQEGAFMGYDRNSTRTILAGGYCNGYTPDVWELNLRGGTCTTNADCDSGSSCITETVPIVGGTTTVSTCCDVSACPACQTCTSASSPGSCVASQQNFPSQSTNTCPSDGVCDGSGNCLPPLGTACTVGTDCASGFCTNGTCCSTSACGTGLTCANSTGTCESILGQACVSNSTCASGACANSVCCNSACTTAGSACNLAGSVGTCAKALGTTCGGNSECASKFCVDGVCCNSACDPTQQCQACNLTGSVGSCTIIPNGSQPTSTRTKCATSSSGDAACSVAKCDGSDRKACHFPGSSASCATVSSCVASGEQDPGGCNGAGACTLTTKSCGVFTCESGACVTSCKSSTDCASGYFCNTTTGACAGLETAGGTCTTNAQCASGLSCTDGVCCQSSTCTNGTCNGSHPGTCTLNNGQPATTSSQCTSALIADGVCCNVACTGQCEACNVTGAVGICTPVTGAPHGSRAACAPGTGDPACSAATCNGALRTACSLPSGNACGGTCTSGTATTIGSCDGTGKCSGETTIACAPYICGANACKTTCASDADCSGGYCNAGECSARLPNGNTCTTGDDCTSKSCVNGVCCGSASCAGGGVCNDPAHLGSCVIEPGGACTSNAQCGTGLCVDGVCCTSSCTGSCEACNVAGSLGSCVPVTTGDKPHGTRAACPGDGTTCNTEQCDGIHTSCQYPGPAIQCGSAACAAGSFEAASFCSGGGKCVASFSSGCAPYVCGTSACKTTCASNTDCASGAFCDTTGHCAYQANAGTSCGSDAACGGTLHCVNNICCNSTSDTCPSGGACVNRTNSSGATELGICKLGNGTACKANDDCVSDFCVDGVCCNSTCGTGSADAADSCGACNLPGFLGLCTPVIGAPQGGRKVCNTDSPATCSSLTCTGGSTACALPTSSTFIGTASCTAGVETDPGPCDGTGNGGATTKPCGSFGCNAAGTACNTTCASDSDCGSGSFCDIVTSSGSGTTGSCAPKGTQGSPCLSSDGCSTGLGCQDGFCCNDVTCDADEGFCGGSHAGTCLKVSGACTSGSDCSSGFCADVDATTGSGVCCDTACDGLCETCSSSESPGKCIPVVGQPAPGHGSCPAPTNPSDVCSGSVCDGTTRATCAGTPGGETICQPAVCSDGSANVDITCNGSGACPTVAASPCANFRTCADATSCNQGPCTTDSDCSNDYTCDKTGHCIPKTAYCDPTDPTQSIGQDGGASSCLPYLCDTSGVCKTSCATTNDCAGGNVCNGGVCAVEAATASKGGCAIGVVGEGTNDDALSLLGLSAIALAVGARRRRVARGVAR